MITNGVTPERSVDDEADATGDGANQLSSMQDLQETCDPDVVYIRRTLQRLSELGADSGADCACELGVDTHGSFCTHDDAPQNCDCGCTCGKQRSLPAVG